ncbi:hypothetical protein PQC36_gp126 [Proteus phage Vb_PmiP-P59]|uniref:Uncharacterized protein n=1 Tax=Proteus phage Vb_PmiP-P59 TaxID=2754975 RepID=A0A7G5CG94_9CAUD|nr:hypothetical protein PQC36_gp126 [Proteus phage Vb_PmiP-P59]QMV48296.1 hypothetical protein [Proteus phage Vb_PmiP-P59]
MGSRLNVAHFEVINMFKVFLAVLITAIQSYNLGRYTQIGDNEAILFYIFMTTVTIGWTVSVAQPFIKK